MIYPYADKLENWGAKYALVTLAAKRAKQLKSGAPSLITSDTRNTLTLALEEIGSGKITSVVADTDEPLVAAQEPEIAQLLAIPSDENLEEESTASATKDEAITEEEILEWDEEVADESEEDDILAIVDEEDDESDPDAVTPLDELINEDAVPKTKSKRKTKVVADPILDDVVEDIPDVDVDLDEVVSEDDTEEGWEE